MAWTEGKIAMLAKLWMDGLSCSEIARRINKAFEEKFSRNAVIGKRVRLGLPDRRESPQRNAGRRPHKPTAKRTRYNDRGAPLKNPTPPPPIAHESAEFDASRQSAGLTSLIDLERVDCKWPIGDPPDAAFGFCGATAVLGQPYCNHHARRAVAAPLIKQRPPPLEPSRPYSPIKSKELV